MDLRSFQRFGNIRTVRRKKIIANRFGNAITLKASEERTQTHKEPIIMAPKNKETSADPKIPTSAPAIVAPPPPAPVAEKAPDAPPPPPPPAPVAEATPAAPIRSGRNGAVVSPEAIQRGIEARNQQSIFNSYLNRSAKESARTTKDRARVAEINEILTRGTIVKSVAAWAGKGDAKRRIGNADKPVKLLPAKRLDLMAEKVDCENRIRIAESTPRVSAEERAEFLKILPAFASRKGYDRAMLIEAGVPEADCAAARIK